MTEEDFGECQAPDLTPTSMASALEGVESLTYRPMAREREMTIFSASGVPPGAKQIPLR